MRYQELIQMNDDSVLFTIHCQIYPLPGGGWSDVRWIIDVQTEISRYFFDLALFWNTISLEGGGIREHVDFKLVVSSYPQNLVSNLLLASHNCQDTWKRQVASRHFIVSPHPKDGVKLLANSSAKKMGRHMTHVQSNATSRRRQTTFGLKFFFNTTPRKLVEVRKMPQLGNSSGSRRVPNTPSAALTAPVSKFNRCETPGDV